MFGWSLLACSAPVGGDLPTGPLDPPPLAAAPPPIVLEPGPYVPATSVSWVVRNVEPGASVWLSWTFLGEGTHGRCPAGLGGTCFDLERGRLYGPIVADLSGSATVTHQFTNPLAPLRDVWAQAAVLRPDGTVGLSAVVLRPMLDPASAFAGDAIVTTEADLLPLLGKTSIAGDLVVDGTELLSLSLPDLRQVGGAVRIWRNEQLATLDLPALAHVTGDLSLYDLPLLDSLAGLGALRTVGGSLSIDRDPALVDLRGLEQLETIGVNLYVFHAVGLTSLAGLDGLRTVGAEVDLWEDYALVDATLPRLETVGTKVDLFECDALTTLSMPALTALRSYELHECDQMLELGDFPQVTALDGALTVQWNDQLRSADGFPALASADAVVIRYNPALASLAGLSSLGSVAEAVELRGLDALPALDLPALADVDRIEVTHNDALADPGLPSLLTVTTEAVFAGNPALSQCALELLFDRVVPPSVVCGENLDDGCGAWCAADTGP